MIENTAQTVGTLLFYLCRLRATKADRFLEQIGLYRGQAHFLVILSRQDGMTHSEIAEKLEISPAAATKVIKRLEKLKYLRRQPDPSDERVSRLYLQEKGHAVINEIHSSFRQLDQIAFQGLSDQQLQTLCNLLTHVQSNLQSNKPVCE